MTNKEAYEMLAKIQGPEVTNQTGQLLAAYGVQETHNQTVGRIKKPVTQEFSDVVKQALTYQFSLINNAN